MKTATTQGPRPGSSLLRPGWAGVLCAGLLAALPAFAQTVCGETADLARMACDHDVEEEHLLGLANCKNLLNTQQRADCRESAHEERTEVQLECDVQHDARLDLCAALGGARYQPSWKRADFVTDPRTLDSASVNPYWPLLIGMRRVYQGDGERITVTVSDATKRIRNGSLLSRAVDCLVVNDLVEEVTDVADAQAFLAASGLPIEDTDDWYAQDLEGSVWYCGEIARNFAVFAGDSPRNAELVDIDGSWKAWVDGATPGRIMLAAPSPGRVYRQELLLGDAEDAGEILSVTARGFLAGDSCSNGDDLVVDPQDLFDSYCSAGDCVVIRDFTPLEPEANEHKYYARGIGMIIAVNQQDLACEALIEMSTP